MKIMSPGRSTSPSPSVPFRSASVLNGLPSDPSPFTDRELSTNQIVLVALIVKKICEQAGLDPARFAGHSLRSGLATEAAYRGASERSIMNQGGWKSSAMARRYIRDGSLFRDNAAGSVGL